MSEVPLYMYRYLYLNVHAPCVHVHLANMYIWRHAASALETRVLVRGGRGSESSESSDDEYDTAESAFALLFSMNNRSDRALALWCFGVFSCVS